MKVKEEMEKYSQNITGVPHYTVSLCVADRLPLYKIMAKSCSNSEQTAIFNVSLNLKSCVSTLYCLVRSMGRWNWVVHNLPRHSKVRLKRPQLKMQTLNSRVVEVLCLWRLCLFCYLSFWVLTFQELWCNN